MFSPLFSIFKEFRERIDELKNHHNQRLDEILSILNDNQQDAYNVASRMKWDIKTDSWENFPVVQRWFATGEAIAHIKYLEEKGIVISELIEGKKMYLLNN